ncbi:tripartite tricarboxylate transporter substrate binding protein [Variovorax humicola]|uniref:Tripartite tricarboxylate transporter substrate binding protein n=1 Tax=Variovorax humicola TaxID=1769758 RepID=A0ABU8W4L0_9BURK
MKNSTRSIAATLLGLAFLANSSAEEPYPREKPLKIVAAFSPGSATDISARIVGEVLKNELGATVVVDNKPGAQGLIGTEAAVRSPADGYTLTITSSSLNSINPGLFKKLPYDAVTSFTHISRLTTMPILLLVKSDGPHANIRDFVSTAKVGKLSYAYGSPGGQVSAVAFNSAAKFDALGVPYKSQPQALTDLAAGLVDYVLADLSVATTLMKGGRIKALAVSSQHRLPEWQTVPTFAESGYKDYDLVVWVGLGGPAGMPADVAKKVNSALNKALNQPGIKEKFRGLGMESAPNSLDEQDAFVRAQLAAWQRRMTEAKIQPE